MTIVALRVMRSGQGSWALCWDAPGYGSMSMVFSGPDAEQRAEQFRKDVVEGKRGLPQ